MPSIQEELRRRTRQSRPQVRFRTAQVVRNVVLTPRLRRVTIASDDLDGCDYGLPADAWKFMLPPPGRRRPDLPTIGPDGMPSFAEGAVPPIPRAYTVRRFDPETRELDIDVLMHGSGPGPAWAAAVEPGDEVGLAGPRHEFFAAPEAGWHLLVGDDSALPAIATILESFAEDTRVIAFIEVEDQGDVLDLAAPRDAEIVWLTRDGAEPTDSGLLEKAVRGLNRPFDGAQAWVGAEAGVVRAVRRHLLDERGLARPSLKAAAYWKAGRTSDERDQEVMTAFQTALAEGADPDDPAVTLQADLA
ncbi:siderophore-interacting protein [Actinomadura sp. DC4]|uniref:siderophore-interacting protein n=1 Tax=Actinomadura sp. DC4 TaxID=3055069 RepID=UPI0025B1D294|nr:siderophore-interacting protein [Actinomadura sp. DC4]MDN3356782.1 siderophore-interacting protein [Actinomadura sp. DC4]